MVNADSERHAPSRLPLPIAVRRRGVQLGAIAILLAVGGTAAFAGCDEDKPCTVQDHNGCTVDGCQNGIPIHIPLDDGHPCFTGKLEGECQAGQCRIACAKEADCNDGNPCTADACVSGTCEVAIDDAADAPPDGNTCTHDSCLGGKPFYWPMPSGTSCAGGKGECESGICSACTTAWDCGANTDCRAWRCTQGTCVADDKEKGTLAETEVEGDCLQLVCNGHGAIDTVAAWDPPTTFDACFSWMCVGWTPVIHPNYRDPCQTTTGVLGVCDAGGECVPCVDDDDCPHPNDHCYDNTCVSCGDNTQNGDETDIDCGGACGACLGEPCTADASCAGDECVLTNAQPPKVCCNAPCDGTCQQCSKDGACGFVPYGQKDVDTCGSPSVACNGSGQCKTKPGYMCMSPLDCITNNCNLMTNLCSN
jgi:hypothetical protein